MGSTLDNQFHDPYDYEIDTRVHIILKDQNGNDLLNNRIDLEQIELENVGEMGNDPLTYKIDPTVIFSPLSIFNINLLTKKMEQAF